MHRFEHPAHLVDKKKPNAKTNFRKTGNSLYCPCKTNDTIRAAFWFDMARDISARLVRLFSENTRLKMGRVRELKIIRATLFRSHLMMLNID
jgi:hypothetical protein